VPQAALVDPELTLGLPPEVTAQSGMDALTQAIESYVGRNANPVSDGLALQAIELLARHLPAAVEDGSRIENREPVALGSLLTGMAFTNTGLGAVHGLAAPLGGKIAAPHGATKSIRNRLKTGRTSGQFLSTRAAAPAAPPNPELLRAEEKIDFYKSEGALAVLQCDSGGFGFVRGFGRPGVNADHWSREKDLASMPIIAVTPEHYNRMYRILKRDIPVKIEL
jgi:hypothetical protein